MKSYELMPTNENLFKTFYEDAIERNDDIFRFADILNSIDDCCSIALDGDWGSGKTFFVKQVKMFLDAYNDFLNQTDDSNKDIIRTLWESRHKNQTANFKPQVCVYYDAWENDNDDDPILSLVYSILNSVDSDFSFSEDTGFMLKASTILEFFSGKNWTKLIENLKSSSPLDEIRKSKNIEKEVEEFLDSLLAERGDRLVIFIDELDRCNPNYAVKLLERIKHYFSNDRITFVFSINTKELQHTIKQCYGNLFDACRYLDRFFDLRISLPPANKAGYYRKLNFNDSNYTYDIVCKAVMDTYNFTLRETAKYVRLTKIAAYVPTHDNSSFRFGFPDGRGIQFGLLFIIPIMIGLKISDSDRYNDFVMGKDYTPLTEIAYCLKDYFFTSLLSHSESFDKEEKDKTFITIEEKLKQVYDAIFATAYSAHNYQTTIGEYTFNENTKIVLLRTSGLLSQFSNMNID